MLPVLLLPACRAVRAVHLRLAMASPNAVGRGGRDRCGGPAEVGPRHEHRIDRIDLPRGSRRQALHRQAEADGRIARDQEQVARAQHPQARLPGRAVLASRTGERQHEAGRGAEAAAEHLAQPFALFRIVEVVELGIDVDRKLPLLVDVGERILVGRDHVLRPDAQALGQRFGKRAGILGVEAVVAIRAADECGIAPERHAVGAPVAGERPARQRLARIPLALAEVQQAPGRKRVAHAREERAREPALVRPHRRRVPLVAVHVVDRHERRLAAHGQAHVAGLELPIDAIAEREDVVPLLVGVRLGDARIFVHARHRHLVMELDLAGAHQARHRRGRLRARRRRERNVPLAGEQAGGGIEAHPAGARQIDLGPGVEIGEVRAGPGGAIEWLLVGAQLNQVAGDEASGQPEVAQRLDEQPRRVAARSAGQPQRVLARLHARLHADDVAHVALQRAD